MPLIPTFEPSKSEIFVRKLRNSNTTKKTLRFVCFQFSVMAFQPVNPKPFLQELTDSYMNLQLANTEEFVDGQSTGALGEVLIRCNNVLYIRGIEEDVEMGGT
ncbi:probable small nuclear ribonucleoprotein F [Rhizophagus clarus]|uniref:Sm protein F n=1 Tax=Rhizophagus clarus TaxID=94130 RepID=A0A8H3QV28_9GLOM|nr:probable small nuclear ribonucleoprotein F [Rhizophagus clarus]